MKKSRRVLLLFGVACSFFVVGIIVAPKVHQAWEARQARKLAQFENEKVLPAPTPPAVVAKKQHAHALLSCLDAWEIETFPGEEWKPLVVTGGSTVREMYRGGKMPFPASAWKKPDSEEGYQNILLLGCFPVKVSLASSSEKAGSQTRLSQPLQLSLVKFDDQEEWEQWFKRTTTLRESSRSPSRIMAPLGVAEDLVILARGCEAGGQNDKALWMIQQVLKLEPDQEQLMKQVQYRYCQWQYALAMEAWIQNVDWAVFKSSLETIAKNAPEDWMYLESLNQLIAKIPTADLISKEADGDKKALLTALYGSGPAFTHTPKGNWLVFPPEEKMAAAGETQRFTALQSGNTRMLSLLLELANDETLCAQIYMDPESHNKDIEDEDDDESDARRRQRHEESRIRDDEKKTDSTPTITWGKPRQIQLRRRPATTAHLVHDLLEKVSLGKVSNSSERLTVIESAKKVEALLKDKTGAEKNIAFLLHGSADVQNKAAYALIDSGYKGPWNEVEEAILTDCSATGRLSPGAQTLLRLRGREAEAFNHRLRTPTGLWAPDKRRIEELENYLTQRTLADVFDQWPQDRVNFSTIMTALRSAVISKRSSSTSGPTGSGGGYASQSLSIGPTTTPARILTTALSAAVTKPNYTGDFLELAGDAIRMLGSGHKTEAAQITQAVNQSPETLQKLLANDTRIPLISRLRGDGMYQTTPAEITAWYTFRLTLPQEKQPTYLPSSSLLGKEWLEALVKSSQEIVAAGKPLDATTLLPFRDGAETATKPGAEQAQTPEAVAAEEKELAEEALKWSAEEFPKKWSQLSLLQRTKVANHRLTTPLPAALQGLRSNVRSSTLAKLGIMDTPISSDYAKQGLQWVTDEASQDRGACAVILWRAGLGGVDVEAETFTDTNALSLAMLRSILTPLISDPQPTTSILAFVRCDKEHRTWKIDPRTCPPERFESELEEWRLKNSDRPFAQTFVTFIAVPKSLIQSIAGDMLPKPFDPTRYGLDRN